MNNYDQCSCGQAKFPKHRCNSVNRIAQEPAEFPTICWKCNGFYLLTDSHCPHCRATNPNVNFHTAMMELNETKP